MGQKICYIGNLASETQKSSLEMILLQQSTAQHKPSIDFID
jgi:hypothetical protein